MSTFFGAPGRVLVSALLAALLAASCAAHAPRLAPRQAIDPAGVPGAVHTAAWDLAAVSFAPAERGFDYLQAGVFPVLLVFRNKGPGYPLISPAEVVGVAPQASFGAYGVAQAADMVAASTYFQSSAEAAFRGGVAGAVIGAGLGALMGAPWGGDAVWRGALVGGGFGALTGATMSLAQARGQLRLAVDDELHMWAWRAVPTPPGAVAVGYVYFPAGRGIDAVTVTIRAGSEVHSHTVPISPPPAPPPAG